MAARLPEAGKVRRREGPNEQEGRTPVSLEDARRQKTGQLVLPLESRGEAPRCQRSGEASTAASGNERPGTDCLMEEVVQRGNAKAALKRVRQNKGSPGVDGMTVDELPECGRGVAGITGYPLSRFYVPNTTASLRRSSSRT